MQPSQLAKLITHALDGSGFRRQSRTWYRTSSECVCLLNLQGASWGGAYFINLAANIHALDPRPNPLEYQCQIRTRIGQIVPNPEQVNEALRLDRAEIPDDLRREVIVAAVRDHALPALDRMGSVSGIRDLVVNKPFPTLTTVSLREFLGLDPDVD